MDIAVTEPGSGPVVEPVRGRERIPSIDVLRGVALLGILLMIFRFGPVEWLWRSLTYLRRQPMRIVPSSITTT